jgi:hypothetical protein
MQTPNADPDRALTGRGSQRTTPSKSAKARSRVAGALRADTEIGDGELSNIDEAEEVEVSRVMPSMTVSRACRTECCGGLLMLVSRVSALLGAFHRITRRITRRSSRCLLICRLELVSNGTHLRCRPCGRDQW